MDRTSEAGRRAWRLAALALLLFLGGAAVLAVPYRHSLSTVRAYEAAPETRGIPAVVRELENSTGRSSSYWVKVAGPPSVAGRIDLDDSGPVLSRLRKGDRIGVVVWHGRRTDITFHGRVQETEEAPTTNPGLALGAGLTMLIGGVLALYAADRLRRRMHEPARCGDADEFPLTCKMIAGAGAVTVLSGLATATEHESGPIAFVVTWIAFALIVLAVWRLERWRDRRSDRWR
ncbi:hypothetical protein ACWGKW_22795 [Streptomyces sp. NPDC054766]|uniref:hypothetical protein n=1 Tax=Streptomyces rhizosphaerihabitans TaxID=1266770 RepID=UPI0021C1157A|nr:hypothetical protein [Streptomyces rhizosphaerihabitans]MCT9008743.1 hypothetical protein [Streptomyces rhizosphaerihabitans]